MTDEPKNIDGVVDFFFEVGILAKTPRSGLYFLGSGKQSVAEHINRVSYIGLALGLMTPSADSGKIVKMCLLHDLHESRISDLNYVHQKYTESFEQKALDDLASTVPFGHELKSLMEEYEKRESVESRLAKDADNLELLLVLKEQFDIGNTRAKSWIDALCKRLLTDIAKTMAERIMVTDSDHWWFGDKSDEWWISRGKKNDMHNKG